MRKSFCIALACLFLLCAVGCAPVRAEDADPAEVLPAVSLAAHKSTQWSRYIDTDADPYYVEESLTVYKQGEAILRHDGVRYRVREEGGVCFLEKDLYAAPWDQEPAVTLDAGKIRVVGTDSEVHIQIVADPLGIFAGFSPEDLGLPLNWYQPGQYWGSSPRYFGGAPHFQQRTEWYERAGHRTVEGSVVYYTNCTLQAAADGTVRGTVQVTHEAAKEGCALLWASDAGALVRPDGELLYYGGLLGSERSSERNSCVQYALKADYDPHCLSVGGSLILYKSMYMSEPDNVLGRSQHQIIADYTDAGWTHEPLSLPWGEYLDYGELFIKLTKDGKMLLIYLDEDIGGRYGREWYALAYVLIGADGVLESWGGFKPGDHTLADKYKVSDPFPFADKGIYGLMEDDDVLILDDGRILVTYSGHESGEVQSFIILDPRG